MTESSDARPPQVTMAGWVTIVGSVFVLFNLFETVANLRSLETRERVERMLSEPPLEGTGIDLDQWLGLLHVVSMVGAACAVTAAILGFYALRRSTSARVGLSVVALPLFATGVVTSGFMSTLVAVSVLMLWTRPARDWFAGRPWVPQTSPSRPVRRSDLEDPSSPQPPTPGQAPWEQGSQPSGQVPPPPPPPWAPPSVDRPMPPTGDARPHAAYGSVSQRPVVAVGRPPALVTACVLTWVLAGLVALGCLLAVLGVVLVPEAVDDQIPREDLADAGVTADQLRSYVLAMGVVFGVWALAAVVLAVFTFLGRQGAWVTLLISTGFAATVFMVLAVGSGLLGVVLVLPALACVATAVLLVRPEVRAWVAAHGVR